MSDLLKTLEITVMNTTAADLDYLAQKSELSVGEVVDRLTARVSSEDPDCAYSLIMDDLALLVAHLSQKNMVKVLSEVAIDLMVAFPPEVIDEIAQAAKEKREEAHKELDILTDEQWEDMDKIIQNLFPDFEEHGPDVPD